MLILKESKLLNSNSTTAGGTLNVNHYATKKTIAETMLDVALLLANASQLKAVLEQDSHFTYFNTVLILLGASLLLQVVAGVLFVVMARKDLNDVANQRKLNAMNNTATGLVFITTIINVFITAFGVQKAELYQKNENGAVGLRKLLPHHRTNGIIGSVQNHKPRTSDRLTEESSECH
ncbi:hypothetical protein DPEC_G00082170 [Dallia pectoralis]|uniref:Uncharacterized protein n=1 Tax=Dallia pectoralis TaxID=75939 RepID=A0ACC2GYN5_DALPE|nr:hypothetical protein DPEC_G00082170 [Dallia pectoralis]